MPYKPRLVEGAALIAALALGMSAVAQTEPAEGDKPPSSSIDYRFATDCAGNGLALAKMLTADAGSAAHYASFGEAYTNWAHARAREKKLARGKADDDIAAVEAESMAMYENAKTRNTDADILKHARTSFEICEMMGKKRA